MKIFWRLLLLLTLANGSQSCTSKVSEPKTPLRVGLPAQWNSSLTPPLQHSAVAAAILANAFEPLVMIGKGGQVLPGLAKSWSVEQGFKKVTFKIDTDKRFSDGSSLTARDFKDAWEKGLAVQPRSSNSSLVDGLGNLKGFEGFKKVGRIAGVQVVDKETLVLEFNKPFRTLFTFLSSVSLSVFKGTVDDPIGTGPYKIESNDGQLVRLVRNKHSDEPVGFPKVEIQTINPDQAEDFIKKRSIDVLLYSEITNFKCEEGTEISCYSGLESSHNLVNINGVSGKLFSDNKMRLALQAISHEYLKNNSPKYDPQVYLPLQAGRIAESKAESIINEGLQFKELLRKASKKNPITILASGAGKAVQEIENILKTNGISFKKTKIVDFQTMLQDYYKEHKYDLTLSGSSVHHGDPDGIYHKLGKDGAIAGPGLKRDRAIPLLEQGRQILNPNKLHQHYQKVNIAILKDAPFIHTGFRSTTTSFNSKYVIIGEKFKERNDARLNKFYPTSNF